LVKRLHAVLLSGLQDGIHLRDLVFADQVANRRRADQDLVCRDPPLTILGLEQRLRNHRAQRFGQHRSDHFLFGSREDVDDPVDGLGGTRGMQGGKYQVAGFRTGERQADGFEVAHLADQNHVRVFAQSRAQGILERQGVRTDFALVDQAFLRLVNKLDRIFDGENVAIRVSLT
jgi:hypothetical protein